MSPEDRKFAFDRLEPVAVSDCEKLRNDLPGLPSDYLEWLGQVGWGELTGNFCFYSGPTQVGFIYGDNAPQGCVVAIGDDMAGYVVGLDLANQDAVEWGPKGDEVTRWPSFAAFVSERVAQLREDALVRES